MGDEFVESMLLSTKEKQQGDGHNESRSDGGESDDEVEKIMAYSVLPGLPPIQATALPAPLSLPSNHSPLEQGFDSMPTSLPPGLDLWQPDEEVSPVCAYSTPSTPYSSGQVSPSASSLVLSTVPRMLTQREVSVVAQAVEGEVKETSTRSTVPPSSDEIMKVLLP